MWLCEIGRAGTDLSLCSKLFKASSGVFKVVQSSVPALHDGEDVETHLAEMIPRPGKRFCCPRRRWADLVRMRSLESSWWNGCRPTAPFS
jgi:hypothetical protein